MLESRKSETYSMFCQVEKITFILFKKHNLGKQKCYLTFKVILPRRADTARDAWSVWRTGEVQHQVTAGRCTGHASSLLGAAVVHFPLWTLPDLYTVWL